MCGKEVSVGAGEGGGNGHLQSHAYTNRCKHTFFIHMYTDIYTRTRTDMLTHPIYIYSYAHAYEYIYTYSLLVCIQPIRCFRVTKKTTFAGSHGRLTPLIPRYIQSQPWSKSKALALVFLVIHLHNVSWKQHLGCMRLCLPLFRRHLGASIEVVLSLSLSLSFSLSLSLSLPSFFPF